MRRSKRTASRREAGSAKSGSADPNDEEGDRNVLAGERDDRQCVEQFVVSEDLRERVWLSPRVDERACGVDEASCREQEDCRQPRAMRELRQSHDPDPTEGDPNYDGDPLR